MENTNNTQKKERRLFFIQLMEEFFDSEDIEGIREVARERQFEYIYIYLQLILKSLATDGYLRKDNLHPYTPQLLRRKINFSTFSGLDEDIKLLDQAIQDLQQLELLYVQNDGTIFMRKVPELVMSKNESSQRVQEWRRKSELYRAEMLNEKKDPQLELDTFYDELFSGLIFINYARRDESIQYRSIIAELLNVYENDRGKLAFAVQQFVDRRKKFPFGKIVDRKNYFFRTISAMKDEIETDPVEQYAIDETKLKQCINIASIEWIDKSE